MIDADVIETLAAHAEELADFDAKLYPKLWADDEGPLGYAVRTMTEFRKATGQYPQRFRCSGLFLRATIEAEYGARRFTPCPDAFTATAICGVPTYVDNALTGYALEVVP